MEWLALGYLTLVVTALAFFLWHAGLVPVAAALLGPLLGAGRFAFPSVLGAPLVAGAVLFGVGRS